MELKRRLSLVVAIMSVALGSGHLVQFVLNSPAEAAIVAAADVPLEITLVAAGPDVVLHEPEPAKISLPVPSFAFEGTEDAPNIFTLPSDPVIVAELGQATGAAAAAGQCPNSLDLSAEPSAMINITLKVPCHANERVVLRHGGLAVTGKTSATGTLFATLPAFGDMALVSVLLRDGQTIDNTVAVSDGKAIRRFGVQWMGDDAFQLHAFEDGASYGEIGHVSAADPRRPIAGEPMESGFLTLLGDDQVDLPMLAEVYTYPVALDAQVQIVVEAAVTKANCAREILGETVADIANDVTVTELSVTMPDCSAIGDILVLKNLDPGMKIAAAN
jgi:hypothetical protein